MRLKKTLTVGLMVSALCAASTSLAQPPVAASAVSPCAVSEPMTCKGTNIAPAAIDLTYPDRLGQRVTAPREVHSCPAGNS